MSAKSFRKNDKGSAAVEFGLVAPVFLLMIFGVFFAGWIAYTTNNVNYALSQITRALQLKPTMNQTQLQTLVRNALTIGGDSTDVTVTLTLETLDTKTKLAHATATYPLTVSVPLLGDYTMLYTTKLTIALVNS